MDNGGREDQILRAAATVIAKRGVCDTRISDIATEVGVSSGLVVYYFRTRDRLLAEALTYAESVYYRTISAELDTLDSPRDQLIRLIERACPPPEGEDYADWVLWLELWSRALRDPELAKKREELDRRWRDLIASIVSAGRRELEFAPVDVDDFVLRLSAVMDGMAIQVVLDDSRMTAQRMRDVALRMAARELGFDLADSPAASSSAVRQR